jgi:hypothetical protein
MSLFRLIFPAANRTFLGKRWVRICLRTLHLIGTAGVGGGFLYHSPREAWIPYLSLTIISGFGIFLIEVWTNAIWIIQIRGVAVLIKLALLSCLHFYQEWATPALVLSIVISGLISHAPGDVRYYSIFHRKKLYEL